MIGNVSAASLLIGFCAGFFAGLLYFGGLWWTAKRIGKAKAALALYVASFALRTALLLIVLYLASKGRPAPLVASLIGVWLARRAAIAYVAGERTASERLNL